MFRAVVRRQRGVSVERLASPHISPGEVRLQVLTAGLCRTDLLAGDGRIDVADGRVLGHEVAAEVIEAPGIDELRPGTRVTVNPILPCRKCRMCSLDPTRCLQPKILGLDADGAFADQMVVPAQVVLPVPRSMELRKAAFVEPVAASMAVLKAGIRRGTRGLVFGHGRIAELTHRVLRVHGFEGVMRSASLELERGGYDFVVETVPSPRVFGALLRALAPGGIMVLKSRPAEPVPLDLSLAVQNELTLKAVRHGDFRQAIELLHSGRLPVQDLFGPTFPLAEGEAAFEEAKAHEDAKVFLVP
jgi:threonine dehydrogenase-like Zn-dependent dehydrogenase